MHKIFKPENLRETPRFALGIARGTVEVFVKPALEESIVWLFGSVVKHTGIVIPVIDFDELDAAIEAEGNRYISGS